MEIKRYFCIHVLQKRYFIEISYDGTPYHGWQVQPNASTVQLCLDRALTTFFRQKVETVGCGRTDSGVHALQFFAHFDLFPPFSENVPGALTGINALLPYSIAVHRIFEVHPESHARFDAVSRSYKYHLHFEKNPFKTNRSWLHKAPLQMEEMNAAAALLLLHTDFSSFSKAHTQTFTNNCKISEALFKVTEDGSWVFHITADRFLRNMVRAIMGTLIQVGKGEIQARDLSAIIESKNRGKAGQSVPACGLYLSEVRYPEGLFNLEKCK